MGISVVILAAGFGTRMKSNKPKVLQKLCQKEMILHILEKAFDLSEDVSVVLGHQKELVESVILSHFPHTQIFTQDIINFPGTAGALRNFKPKNSRSLILCGDMPLISSQSLENLAKSKASLNLATFESKEPKNYGRVIIKNEKIEKIVEFKDTNENEKKITLCNAGVYALNSALLTRLLPEIKNKNEAREFYLTDLISLAVKNGEDARAILVDETEFMGVNDKIELAKAENLMQEKIKNHWMREGVIFHNPKSSFISPDARFLGECEIYENVRIEGKSVIESSIIKSSSVIESSKLENSTIGPFAHLRPNCELKNSQIGNFVECKNAKLNGVKAGHLSYLGDCEIDEGTNIGAGCITCNYDGVKKHKTIIGKKVFIGSDSQLIAPLKIEDESIIAAGSCVSCDVHSGALFINRATKKIIPNFFQKKFGK